MEGGVAGEEPRPLAPPGLVKESGEIRGETWQVDRRSTGPRRGPRLWRLCQLGATGGRLTVSEPVPAVAVRVQVRVAARTRITSDSGLLLTSTGRSLRAGSQSSGRTLPCEDAQDLSLSSIRHLLES